MNFETLVQELSNAYPWTLEKVEKIIGKKLERPANLPSSRTEYEAKDIVLDGGLVIDRANISASNKTQELSLIDVRLKTDSLCITSDRVKKSYPLSNPSFVPAMPIEASKTLYTVPQAWGGKIAFMFEQQDEKCLLNIYLSSPNR